MYLELELGQSTLRSPGAQARRQIGWRHRGEECYAGHGQAALSRQHQELEGNPRADAVR